MYSKIYNTLPMLIKLYLIWAYEHTNMRKKKNLVWSYRHFSSCSRAHKPKKDKSIMSKNVYGRK